MSNNIVYENKVLDFTMSHYFDITEDLASSIEVGETYIVGWNGELYECIARDEGGGTCLGNDGLTTPITGVPVNGEDVPFYFYCSREQAFCQVFAPMTIEDGAPKFAGMCSVVISKKVNESQLFNDWFNDMFVNEAKSALVAHNNTHYDYNDVILDFHNESDTNYKGIPIHITKKLVVGDTYTVVVDGVEYEVVCTKEWETEYPILNFRFNNDQNYMTIKWIDDEYQTFACNTRCRVIVKKASVKQIPSRFIPCTTFYARPLPQHWNKDGYPELLYVDKECTIGATRKDVLEAYKHVNIIIYPFTAEGYNGPENAERIPVAIEDHYSEVMIVYFTRPDVQRNALTEEARSAVENMPV